MGISTDMDELFGNQDFPDVPEIPYREPTEDDLPVYDIRVKRRRKTGPEDWMSHYYTDLHNLWLKIEEYLNDTGAGSYMLEDLDFSRFCRICYHESSGRMDKNAPM